LLTTVLSTLLAMAVLAVVIAPAWWLAGRLLGSESRPFFRLLLAFALGIIGYLSFVNLVGRQLENSTTVASFYIAACLALALWLQRRWPTEMSFMPVAASWREWMPFVAGALVLGIPQWLLTVSTPYWDEVAASAIHITAPNQFAEGVFPPRHNALPAIPIKYHYAFTILSGSVHWLTGLTSNRSIDIASTVLWLFTFLFIVFWLRELRVGKAASFWGGAASLLGGGLVWAYLKKVEAYSGFAIVPEKGALLHAFKPDSGVAWNMLEAMRVPSDYLRNGNGSISNLPWDVAAQFQQHAVALGIALTLPALWMLVRWQTRSDNRWTMLALSIITYSVLFLCHAVFGGVAAVTAGLVLLGVWLRAPTRERFMNGVLFFVGVMVVALAHGGFLARGAEYGSATDVFTWRGRLGYSLGGLTGFLNWNLAGFGIPLLLALVGWGAIAWQARRAGVRIPRSPQEMAPSSFALLVFSVFAVFSYMLPQLAYYSAENSGVEQLTEISKFFFAARLGFALVSVWGVIALLQRVHWMALAPLGVAMAITPIAFSWVASTKATPEGRKLLGYYRSPYYRGSIEEQMAAEFKKRKHGPRDVYFDASADERGVGFLSEMLVFGGSAFEVTPSAYERTGSGYRLAQSVVAKRFVQNSRMVRLLPGAAEDCQCRWFYSRPERDFKFAPLIVRARFAKLVAESVFVMRQFGADRVLYEIVKPTTGVDGGIERYWRPRIVSQAHSDLDGDGRDDLVFYDYVNHEVIVANSRIKVPEPVQGEFTQLYMGRFPGDRKSDIHFGRTADTEFKLGRSIYDILEYSPWKWSYLPSQTGKWEPEYERFFWNIDIPLIADLDGDGFDTHVIYRPRSNEWWAAPNVRVAGPFAAHEQTTLPFAGRFSRRSKGDLGVWAKASSTFTIKSPTSAILMQFRWGGSPRDVLVPGDYAGLGFDQLAIWNPDNQYWYWRTVPDGAITQFQFGTATSVPVPADYNHDGVVDPAYWEPAANKIYVTFSRGRRVDLVVPVPANSIPAFVNWL
jgi:hypothetical protein